MKRLAWLVVCAASIWVRGAEASAQALAPAVYVSYGSTRLASADTFNTIAGSSAKTGIGFGGKVDAPLGPVGNAFEREPHNTARRVGAVGVWIDAVAGQPQHGLREVRELCCA